MKARVKNEDGFQLSTICKQLKLEASDGKKYETDCADTEGVFRIIQSIPSPKAEPFPFWEQLKLPAEDGKMRETDCAVALHTRNL